MVNNITQEDKESRVFVRIIQEERKVVFLFVKTIKGEKSGFC